RRGGFLRGLGFRFCSGSATATSGASAAASLLLTGDSPQSFDQLYWQPHTLNTYGKWGRHSCLPFASRKTRIQADKNVCPTMDDIDAYLTTNNQQFENELCALVRIPSIVADTYHHGEGRNAA